MPNRPRRRATRPVDLPEDRREEREEAYKQWGISARERGRQIEWPLEEDKVVPDGSVG